jgi:hypothetical protein
MNPSSKKPDLPMIHCPRLNAMRSATEHLECSYCFGRLAEVAWGDHRNFCDYRPGVDPIHFGFPTDRGRWTQG